ncbi:MAG: hypothetical protein JNK90_23870 [Planctomycetaceae bacterium]|nr:hypothetical protein [Planctomycetaceae bacterium]
MNTPLKIHSLLLFVCLAAQVGAVSAQTPRSSCDKVDWSTLPSRFTHDPTGQRVPQYAAKIEPVAQVRSDYQRSGYRNFRSSLQVGSSADNMHIVEEWGNPVQPYEAWRFPYRPYGVPYQQWGPNTQFWGASPFWPGYFPPGGPGMQQPWAMPAVGANGGAGDAMIDQLPPGNGPGNGPGGFPPGYYPPGNGHWQNPYGPGNFGRGTAPWNPGVGPWTDGYYHDAPQQPRMPDRQFFYTPRM